MINIFLYLSIFLIPFYFFRLNLLGLPTNIFEISVFITLVLFLSDLFLHKKKIKLLNFDWVMIAFLIFAVVAVLLSPDKSTALGILKGWFIVPAIMYFVAKESISLKNIHKLAIPLFLSLLVVSTWSILQKFGVVSTLFYQAGDQNFQQYLSGNVRLFGPFASPNYLAMFIVPVFFLSLSLFSKIKNIALKIIFLILESAPLYVLYYSKSRGGILALAAALLILTIGYILNKFKIHRSSNLKAVIAFIMTVFAFLVYRLGFSPERDQTRIEIYKYSWQMLKSNYLTGIGFGNFQNKIDMLSESNGNFQTFILPAALHPHNLYLAVWLYLGIGGFISFIILVSQFFARAFRALDEKIVIYPIAAMTAILVHGLVDTTYFKNDLSAIFFLTIALIAILERHAKAHN